MTDKAKAAEEKNKGNKAFVEKNFKDAVKWYTEAIKYDSTDHTFFSNRAAAYLGMNDYQNALKDADQSITIKNDWSKGWYRRGQAQQALNMLEEALFSLEKASKFDPANDDIKNKVWEVKGKVNDEKRKPKKVDKDGKPLSAAMLMKEEGNVHFRESRYEKALEAYTKALDLTSTPEEKETLLVNRAAVYSTNTMQNYDHAIVDCTNALEINPHNLKALLRRGLAYEAIEKYKLSLQDMKTVIKADPQNKVANEATHRLQKAIARMAQK